MRRIVLSSFFVAFACSSLGCHHDKYNLSAKFDEEYVVPPNEPRFNNPPESGYKKPPKKKQDDVRNQPGLTPGGGGGGVGRGMGANGFQ
jgi:hypothetical protein